MKKKISTLIMALTMVSAITATTGIEAKAATSSWNLRYVQHAESSANQTTWARYVNTTTTMKINKVGGGAQVYAHTSNGISMLSAGTATSYVPTVKNKQIYVYVGYSVYGTSNSYPSGSVTY